VYDGIEHFSYIFPYTISYHFATSEFNKKWKTSEVFFCNSHILKILKLKSLFRKRKKVEEIHKHIAKLKII